MSFFVQYYNVHPKKDVNLRIRRNIEFNLTRFVDEEDKLFLVVSLEKNTFIARLNLITEESHIHVKADSDSLNTAVNDAIRKLVLSLMSREDIKKGSNILYN